MLIYYVKQYETKTHTLIVKYETLNNNKILMHIT